jgi:hypothetical protein
MFDVNKARQFLQLAGVFYYDDRSELEDGDDPKDLQTLNMNDTWAWATGWGEYVPDDELPEVARLFWNYGWCGILYWMSERHDQMKSEFHDINRFVEFVRREEDIRKEVPDSSERAYVKREYVLGK